MDGFVHKILGRKQLMRSDCGTPVTIIMLYWQDGMQQFKFTIHQVQHSWICVHCHKRKFFTITSFCHLNNATVAFHKHLKQSTFHVIKIITRTRLHNEQQNDTSYVSVYKRRWTRLSMRKKKYIYIYIYYCLNWKPRNKVYHTAGQLNMLTVLQTSSTAVNSYFEHWKCSQKPDCSSQVMR